jgi:hypothetical protein
VFPFLVSPSKKSMLRVPQTVYQPLALSHWPLAVGSWPLAFGR